jgi:transposase
MVKSMGGRLPKCTTAAFAGKAPQWIPAELKMATEPVLKSIATINEQIRAADEQIARLAEERYPETKLLRQVKGVGPVIALTYVLTLEDPYRFAKSRTVGSYLGLRPRQRDSGDSAPQLGISKSGNRHLRWLFGAGGAVYLGTAGAGQPIATMGSGAGIARGKEQ